MLDMGFTRELEQISNSINSDLRKTGAERTTAMFSATFPRQIQKLARRFLREYCFLTVGQVGGVSSDIEQKVIFCEKSEKLKKLVDILQDVPEEDLVIVFCETKRLTDQLSKKLVQLGAPSTCIHGDLSQSQRERALYDFKSGKKGILCATDVSS